MSGNISRATKNPLLFHIFWADIIVIEGVERDQRGTRGKRDNDLLAKDLGIILEERYYVSLDNMVAQLPWCL